MENKGISQSDDWNMNGDGGFKNINGNLKDELHDGLPRYQLVRLILDSLDSMGYRFVVQIITFIINLFIFC